MTRKNTNESHLSSMAMKAEMDHEVQMARSDLFKIAKYAVELHDMLKSVSEAEGLEGWQQSKITKAADYLGSVYHSMDYEVNVNESEQLEENPLRLAKAGVKAGAEKLSKFMKKGKKVAKAADQGIKTAQFSGKAARAYKSAAALQSEMANNPRKVKRILSKAGISFEGVEELIDRAVDRGRASANTSGQSTRSLELLIKDTNKMVNDLGKIRNQIAEEDVLRTIMAGIIGSVLVIGTVEAQKAKNNVEEGAKPDFLDVDGDGDKKEPMKKAIKDKKKKSTNETMLSQLNKAILFQEGKIGRANMSPKAFELAEMHHKDLAVLKADFERKVIAEGQYGEITHHDEDATQSEVLVKGMGVYRMDQLEQRIKDRINNVAQLLDRGEPDQAARLLDANSSTYKSLIVMMHAYAEAHDDLAFGDQSNMAEDIVDEDDVDEGNEFSGALADAKKNGKDEFEVDGKTYKVNEAGKYAKKNKTEAVEGVCKDCRNPSWKTLPEEKKKGSHGKVCWKGYRRGKGNSCHKVDG